MIPRMSFIQIAALLALMLTSCTNNDISTGNEGSVDDMWSDGSPSSTPAAAADSSAKTPKPDFIPKAPAADELCRSIEAGDAEKAASVIAARPETLNGRDVRGRTPLGLAIKNDNIEIVKLLLAAGADANKKNRSGQSPLYLACEVNNPAMVELLFSYRHVLVDQKDLDEQLMVVSSHLDMKSFMDGMFEMLKRRKEQEKRLGRKVANNAANQALDELAKRPPNSPEFIRNRLRIAEILLEHGANPNTEFSGPSAVTAAAWSPTSDSLQLLLKNGANPDSGSALRYAVLMSRKENVRLLLAAGADPLYIQKNVPTGTIDFPMAVKNLQDQESALATACARGDMESVRQFLAVIKDRSRLSDDRNGLRVAARFEYVEIVKLLLENGAGTQAKSEEGVTALHAAVLSDSVETTEILISAGCNINARDKAGFTPLATAVERNKRRQVEVLLGRGAAMEIANNNGLTPLLIAAGSGFNDTLKTLLEAGADPHAKSSQGYNALQVAVSSIKQPKLSGTERGWDYPETLRLLLKAGLPVNDPAGKKGYPALYFASANDQVEIVKILLAEGASVNEVGLHDGSTALYQAAAGGSPELIALLLDHGSDIEARAADQLKFTPLLMASAQGKIENVKLLLQQGANLKAKSTQGGSALHYAARMNQLEVVRFLLAQGIDVDVRDNQDMTPLHLATNYGHRETVALLIENDANVNAVGEGGLTSLAIANAMWQADIANLLKSNGALH